MSPYLNCPLCDKVLNYALHSNMGSIEDYENYWCKTKYNNVSHFAFNCNINSNNWFVLHFDIEEYFVTINLQLNCTKIRSRYKPSRYKPYNQTFNQVINFDFTDRVKLLEKIQTIINFS